MGHATMENRHGLAVAGMVTHTNGTAERRASEIMLKAKSKAAGRRITAGEDKAYDTTDHVANLRAINVTPHVTQNQAVTKTGKTRNSAIDQRTTRHRGYGMSQSRRAMIECIFGWGKQHGTMRKTKHRGIRRVAADFLLNLIAYTSPTNGPRIAFEGLTKTKYWRKVRDAFGGIRVDFGHFGDSDLVEDKSTRARHLSDLMDQADGQFLYADSAYFADLLSQQAELQTYLAALLQHSKNKGSAALAQRLMYGTDWEMVVLEGPKSEQYLQRFEDVFSVLDKESLGAQGKLSDRFFGVNAAIFLGSRTGQPTRQRLDRYYGLGSKPAWMAKVDKLAALAA